jgi:pimeloyl-ACP methyl ester carboxylesterase
MRITETAERGSNLPDGLLRLDTVSDTDGLADWALALPPAKATCTWIINLHGHGANGDQLYTRPDLKPRKERLIASGYGILTPNLRGNAWMCPEAVRDLRSLLEYLRIEHGAREFAFFSGSMGGTSSLIYAVCHPEDVRIILALCPATDIASYYEWLRAGSLPVHREIADAILEVYHGDSETRLDIFDKHSALKHVERLNMPLAIVHGDADQVIPVSQARELVHRLTDIGRQPLYMEIAKGNHDSPINASSEALEWMLRNLAR